MDVLTIWILYSAFGVTVFALVFLWAVRTGQFRDQDRARYLPLEKAGDASAEACPPAEDQQ